MRRGIGRWRSKRTRQNPSDISVMPPRGSEEDYLMSLLVENRCDDSDIGQMTGGRNLSVSI